jgi:hypothetical protein
MKDSIKLLSVPVLNRYDLLEKMIESIDYPIDEILILNNGKEKYIPKNKNFNFTILDLPSNLGCSGSWNLTVKLYPHLKYWCFASADILFTTGSLSKLQQESNSDFLCLSNRFTSAFSIGENLIKEVGLFDENYYPIYFEYMDYIKRIEKHNLQNNIKFNSFEIQEINDAQTIKSNNTFFEKNKITEKNNKEYLLSKINTNFPYVPWSINKRRNNEWLQQ